jgi:PemK-like, MazF-like toxin of type II toxin-antitoxin system
VPLPDPFPGLVLHYSYLWHDEHRRGQEEGTKNRPCVVVLAVATEDGETVVTVVPVTHASPRTLGEAVEIPAATKARLGLDDGRSRIVVNEINGSNPTLGAVAGGRGVAKSSGGGSSVVQAGG